MLVIKDLITSSSAQEYNQIIIQSHLISYMLDKTITYYGRSNPHELSRVEWIFDRKNETPKTFETLYTKVMPSTVEVDFIREPRGIPLTPKEIKYFLRNYGNKESLYGMDKAEIFSK